MCVVYSFKEANFYILIPVRKSKIKSIEDSLCWRGYRVRGSLHHCFLWESWPVKEIFFVFKWRFSNLYFLPTSFSKCLCMYVICMHNCNLFDFYADHSVGRHFVLLTVLFALQKLLSFLRSHVLILVCALLVFYSGSCILC